MPKINDYVTAKTTSGYTTSGTVKSIDVKKNTMDIIDDCGDTEICQLATAKYETKIVSTKPTYGVCGCGSPIGECDGNSPYCG